MINTFTTEKIISEVKKLLYLYSLKQTIRYGQSRDKNDYTESVADHVYGMHLISDYFLPLEDPDYKMNKTRIQELITWHDIVEVETGDIPRVRKTQKDNDYELIAIKEVVQKAPDSLKLIIKELTTEYETQTTPESRFVKAIDKIEPLIHCYHPLGKFTQQNLKLTVESSREVKEKYIANFPYIKLFSDTLHKVMESEGYFYKNKI
ncbi:HD domain-containing protein [Candidatus Kaiserbacteria bacterium]|nr:HD domain-containing protein [Candidatus Kaiserbacteria bacterium]